MSKATERAHESLDQMSKTAHKTAKRIRHEAADAESHVRDAGKKVKQRSDDTLQSVSTFVEDNPLTSVGLAFSAGALLASAIRRWS